MLLEKNVTWAREKLGCSKVTLEVRDDNLVAKSLYKSLGFKDSDPPMLYWTKML
jgi:ribosomal protein S18 acetylase RimI-like enzyme